MTDSRLTQVEGTSQRLGNEQLCGEALPKGTVVIAVSAPWSRPIQRSMRHRTQAVCSDAPTDERRCPDFCSGSYARTLDFGVRAYGRCSANSPAYLGRGSRSPFPGLFIRTAHLSTMQLPVNDGNRAIGSSHCSTYPIPLPPLSEQRRIVAKIEQLASKIEEARGLRGKSSQKRIVAVRVELHCFATMLPASTGDAFGSLGDVVADSSTPAPSQSTLHDGSPRV